MILEFTSGNFLSFKEKNSISFDISGIKGAEENVYIDPSIESDIKLLKSISIYGSNASGKTNFLKAFSFMKHWVLNSFLESNRVVEIPVTPFLLREGYIDKPTYFEVIFFAENVKYRYGFELTSDKIENEWLYYSEHKKREQNFFFRTEQGIKYNNAWKKSMSTKIDPIISYVRPRVLFASVLAQFNIPIGIKIIDWFNKNLLGFDYNSDYHINKTASLLSDDEYYLAIHELINGASLGFESVNTTSIGRYRQNEKFGQDFLEFALTDDLDEYLIETKHDVYNAENKLIKKVMFDLKKNESEGTQKFFALAGALLTAIKNKQILWVDELDSKFHPFLFETIIKFFNSNKFNHRGAQLIFTTHSTQLLKEKILRRDQIYTTSKNKYGESSLLGMHTAKIRIDSSHEKEYFAGNIGHLEKVDFGKIQLDLFGEPVNKKK